MVASCWLLILLFNSQIWGCVIFDNKKVSEKKTNQFNHFWENWHLATIAYPQSRSFQALLVWDYLYWTQRLVPSTPTYRKAKMWFNNYKKITTYESWRYLQNILLYYHRQVQLKSVHGTALAQLCIWLSRHIGSCCAGQQLTGKVANRADIEAHVKDGVPSGESIQAGLKDCGSPAS